MKASMLKKESLEEGRGFTLMETLIVIMVVGIIMTGAAPFLKVNINSYQTVLANKTMIQGARIAMNRMIAELKRTVPAGISAVSSTSITFSIRDENNTLEPNIIFSYVQANVSNPVGYINRASPSGAAAYFLMQGVINFSIDGYDMNNSPTMTAGDVRRIKIMMQVGRSSSQSYSLTGEVFPRNLQP
jgi:prepilin-type N-terminal cleavage/methylation domain-containing protein